jgi:hypothetical protein
MMKGMAEVAEEAAKLDGASADPSRLEGPAGFKQVEAEMLKQTRR